jgi:sulfite exporter TauE/SafE/copper chaperone CopZ
MIRQRNERKENELSFPNEAGLSREIKREISIIGMHCKSCEKMIKDELMEVDGVKSANVSLKQNTAYVKADDSVSDYEIEQAIRRAGYQVGSEDRPLISRDGDTWRTVVKGIIITAILFFIVSKIGLNPDNFGVSENNGSIYGLIMGLVAGFSTCMALIGGLVVGLTARHEERHPSASKWQNFRPNIFFNLGRIGGFVVLGGLLGLLGSALTFTPLMTGILSVLAGIFMLVIGLQLTGIFPRLTTLSLPPKIAEKLGLDKHRKKEYSHSSAIILGVLSFFLPCGFTQAMQIFAVSTGSPLSGALAMGLFALGTTPGLLLVGGAASLVNGEKGKTAMKIVGVIVAGLAFVNINTGLLLSGWRLPEFDLSSNTSQTAPISGEVVELEFNGPSKQFDKSEIILKRGQEYTIVIKPNANGSGCMYGVILPGLSNENAKTLKKGQELRFVVKPEKTGKYRFLCPMGIPFNTIIKVEE